MTDEGAGTQTSGTSADPLAQFILDLAKAMLRTGYYAPDHPQAQRSLEGLHEEFRSAVGDGSELTFLVGQAGDAETVLVQVHGEEPKTLDHIMVRGMAELFSPKLLDFFHRRHLLSFALRASIRPEELVDFVVLMSEPPQAGRADDERERVERFFVDRHIINVSTVFRADVVGRERRLPWRVQMALSRLGRDLRLLPLYRKVTPEELQRVKMEIIAEVMRPLQAPGLLKELLLNCDLLAAGAQVLGINEIEGEIIGQVPPERLKSACQEIIDGASEVEPGGSPDDTELAHRRRAVLRHALRVLVFSGIHLESALVEACVKERAATFEELPRSLRVQLKRRRAVDTFLVRRDEYLESFAAIPSGDRGKELAETAEVLFAGCLNRDLFVEASDILHALQEGSHEPGEGAGVVGEAVARMQAFMASEEVHDRVLDGLAGEGLSRPDAEALVALVSFTGKAVSGKLLRLYNESGREEVREHVFSAVRGIGPAALIPFLTELSVGDEEWPVVHHVLASLAGSRQPELARAIRPFLEHGNPRIRQAALARIFEIMGTSAEGGLIRALHDPDPSVRHAAVVYLGRLRSRSPEAMAFVTAALGGERGAQQPETSDEVLVECCRLLTLVAESSPEGGSEIEGILLAALTPPDHGGLVGRFRKSASRFSARVQVAICEALGQVGTQAALERLARLASGEGEVADAARGAAERIQGRGHRTA